jgi:lipopolysaccharide export system permease protein
MRLSPIFCLYLGRAFLRAFFGALGVIMGLIYLSDVIELMRRAATHGSATMVTVFQLAAFKLPQMIEQVLPFAILIGAMTCFWGLTRSRELVVVRSVGVSAWQFLVPILAAAAIIGVLNITLINPLAAAFLRSYERLEDKLALNGPSNPLVVSESGMWLREVHDSQQIVTHADAVRQEGFVLRFRHVSVIIADGKGQFLYRIEAVLGELHDGYFHLSNVDIMRAGAAVEHRATYDFPTQLTLGRVVDKFASPETISFWELPSFIRFFESSGFSASRQRLYLESLLASPLLLCAMVLLAASFSLQPNLRSGGAMRRIVGLIAVGFIFYFFSRVVYALGLSATLPVMLAAWTPAVGTSLVGLGALFHLEDG